MLGVGGVDGLRGGGGCYLRNIHAIMRVSKYLFLENNDYEDIFLLNVLSIEGQLNQTGEGCKASPYTHLTTGLIPQLTTEPLR